MSDAHTWQREGRILLRPICDRSRTQRIASLPLPNVRFARAWLAVDPERLSTRVPSVRIAHGWLMGRRKRGRETYRGRLGGTPRPTVGQMCALLVCGSSVGASGNACAVSNGMCRQRTRGEAKRMRTGAREDGWMRKTPPKRRCMAQGGIPTKPDTPLRRMDCADQGGRVARAASGAAPRTAGRRRANRGG